MVSEPRLVVIDDTDPRIQYSGSGWFQDLGSRDDAGTFGSPYESTLHGTESNASLSFSFSGSRVLVTGSNNPRNDSGVTDPTWDCFVDNISIGATAPYAFAENNWVFCEQDNLVDGPHVITVNVTVMKKQTFWFDRIQYIPSASVPLDKEAVLVNNLDPSLQFGQGWKALGRTANMTTSVDSTFTFSFVGRSLSWFAFIPTELPHAPATGSYSVDGGAAVNFLLKGLPSDATTTIYNQKFFETPSYPAGPHEIVVAFLGNSSTTPLALDYLIVQNSPFSPRILASSPSTTYGNGISTYSIFMSTTSTDTSLSTRSTIGAPSSTGGTSGSSQSSNISPIIGGTVGGVLLVALVIAVLIYFRQMAKWNKKNAASQSRDKRPEVWTVEPFLGAPTVPPNGTALGSTQQQPSQSSRAGKTRQHAPQPAQSTTDVNSVIPLKPLPSPPNIAPHNLANTTANPSGDEPAESSSGGPMSQRIIRHQDSGVRLRTDRSEQEVVEIPPEYTPS